MKALVCLFFAGVAIVFASSEGYSQSRPYNVNKHQVNQQQRIYKGVQNGELTRSETYRIERQQVRINNMEARYRSTGDGLSKWERADLLKHQAAASANIYKQKHDRQDRNGPIIP